VLKIPKDFEILKLILMAQKSIKNKHHQMVKMVAMLRIFSADRKNFYDVLTCEGGIENE
jgi:hypothetical protein